MRNANIFATVLLVIAIIGALNWGLVGFFDYNLIDALFGATPSSDTNWGARVVYSVVGLAGLAALFVIPTIGKALAVDRPAPSAAS